ncbi:MAG: hypothetical protein IPP07_02785 [Holophagales bacterium]|nr:hypothetical protein [Holophagales bacterium]
MYANETCVSVGAKFASVSSDVKAEPPEGERTIGIVSVVVGVSATYS